MGTNAHDIWDYVVSVDEKTCVIDHHPVSYVWARCTTVCFDFAESLDTVIETMLVLKGVNLHWFRLVSAKCAGCRKLGHTLLVCPIGGKKYVPSGASLCKPLLDLNKSRLAAIYAKRLAPNVLLKAGFSLEMKPTLLVSLELDNRFAALKHSLTSLTKCVDMLAKRLETLEPMVSQLSPEHQPLVTPSSQNQGVDIVMSKSLGVATDSKTVMGVVVFDPAVISKMEKTLNNLSITVMSLLAKLDNAGSNDIIRWHKEKNNLVSTFIESKLKGKMFTSGLESGNLGASVVIVMNSFLARHLLSIKLLFKNKLSVSILGLYAGVFLVARFSQAGNINFFIAKAVNKFSFVILGGDFMKTKCLDFGLVNALGGSSSEKLPTWSNFWGIVKTIDYVLISSNLVKAVLGCGVFGIEEYFDTDYQMVSVLVGLGSLLDKYNYKGVNVIKWAKFKDNTAANAAMFYDEFFTAKMCSDLNVIWAALHKVLCLSAEAVFKKKWFKNYDHVFVKESSKFHKLELLVSKLVKASCLDSFREFTFLLDKWESLDLVNESVVKSVLERLFCKVTLDHLVVDDELVLESDLVKTKPLEYVFDKAFSSVMCSIDFDEMSDVISNLFDGKAAGFSGISNELWKHYNRSVLDMLLVLLNFCLDCESVSGLWKEAWVSMIPKPYERDNFFVLKDMTTQSPIFAIELVVENALEKNLKRQGSICGYRLNSHFVTRTGCSESWAGLTSFLAAGAFVNDTIWVGSNQTATQHILNIASKFFQINNILINNDKMVAIPINCRVSDLCLLISDLPILIVKKKEPYRYLGIFLSTEDLSKPSLARAYLDVRFFTNLMLRKTISDKQFLYLVLAVLHPIVVYRTQFSFVSLNVCAK
ncbi:hypothetical protein G9A89_012503 [Geosiphon pyriformis]|nr:hypothetical protein G9A89_012503 [Geosiphon pyriformis]